MVFADFPDTLMLLNRIGVRAVNDVTAQVTAEATAVMDPEGMGIHMGTGAASASVDIEMTLQPNIAHGGSSVVTKAQDDVEMCGVEMQPDLEKNQSMYNSMVEYMDKLTANHQELTAKLTSTQQELQANHQEVTAKLTSTQQELQTLQASTQKIAETAVSEAGYNAENRASTQRIGILLKTNTTKIDSHLKTYLCKVADVERAADKKTALYEKRMAAQDEQIAQQNLEMALYRVDIKTALTAEMNTNWQQAQKKMDAEMAQLQGTTQKSMLQFKKTWTKKHINEIEQKDAVIVKLHDEIAAANALVLSLQNKPSSVAKRAAENNQGQGPVPKKKRAAPTRTEQ